MANNDHDGYTVGAASSHQDRCTIGIINNYAPGNGTSAALVAFVGRVSSAPQRLSWPCRLRIAGVKLAARQMCAQAPGGNNRRVEHVPSVNYRLLCRCRSTIFISMIIRRLSLYCIVHISYVRHAFECDLAMKWSCEYKLTGWLQPYWRAAKVFFRTFW